MANEAVIIEKPSRYARYTVSDGITIPKGTILALTSPNFASACTAANDIPAGIAMFEKSASDGSTEITAALDGVWSVYGSSGCGTINAGQGCVIVGANLVASAATLDFEKGYVLGRALETSSAAAGLTLKCRVNVI